MSDETVTPSRTAYPKTAFFVAAFAVSLITWCFRQFYVGVQNALNGKSNFVSTDED
jgi:hypothetical protein